MLHISCNIGTYILACDLPNMYSMLPQPSGWPEMYVQSLRAAGLGYAYQVNHFCLITIQPIINITGGESRKHMGIQN